MPVSIVATPSNRLEPIGYTMAMLRLRFLDPADGSERTFILQDEWTVIGRDPGAGLSLDDPHLQAHHAYLRYWEGAWWVQDPGGVNGVWVNGQRVVDHRLAPGDQVQVGGTILLFECPEGLGVPPSPPLLSPSTPPRRRWIWLLVPGAMLLLAVLAFLGWTVWGMFKTPEPSPERRAAVLQAALQFRAQAMSDLGAAMASQGTPEAAAGLKVLEPDLWGRSPARSEWAWLMQTSLVCMGRGSRDAIPVAYYHPWSDLFVITQWSTATPPRLTDLEVVMADVLRRGGATPFDPLPAWEWNAAVYPPLCLGVAAARSVRAFDGAFAGPARDGGDWRLRVPALRDPVLLEANRVGAGLQLMRGMARLGPFLTPGPEDPLARLAHRRLARLMVQLENGSLRTALDEADATLPETREVLLGWPITAWREIRPAAYLEGGDSALVFFAKRDQTDLFLAVQLKMDGRAARLKRLDLLSFQAFARGGEALAAEVGL